jgi:hypothetical protein
MEHNVGGPPNVDRRHITLEETLRTVNVEGVVFTEVPEIESSELLDVGNLYLERLELTT